MNFKEHFDRLLAHNPERRTQFRLGSPEMRVSFVLREGRAFLDLSQRQMARHIGIPRHHLKLAEMTGKISHREFSLFLISMGFSPENPEKENNDDPTSTTDTGSTAGLDAVPGQGPDPGDSAAR